MIVTRHSHFLRHGEKSISLVEKHPPGGELDGVLDCGCTRHTTERPEGTPDHVADELEIRFVPTASARRSEEILVRFDLREASIRFRWGHQPIDRPCRRPSPSGPCSYYGDFNEASFHFSCHEQAMWVGVSALVEDPTLPASVEAFEGDPSRYFHAEIYRGRSIDVRGFMNGGCPSNVVRFGHPGEDAPLIGGSGELCPATEEALANGRSVSDDDVWVHHRRAIYGGEAFGILTKEDPEEAARWGAAMLAMRGAARAWHEASSAEVPLSEVARRVEVSTIGADVVLVCGILSSLFDRVGDTSLFRLERALRGEADRRGREKLEADERERQAFRDAHPEIRAQVDAAAEAWKATGEHPIIAPLRELFAAKGMVLVDVTPGRDEPPDA